MSKKNLPAKKVKETNLNPPVTHEEIFEQEWDLDTKISHMRKKQGLPDPPRKHDCYNEDKSMDKNVL